MPIVRLKSLIAVFVLAVGSRQSLLAQAGAATDIVRGVVTGEDGQPVIGAQVSVTSLESGITRTLVTDARGRYTAVFVDGGGRYRVNARSIGYTPVTMLVSRLADEDVLVANLRMGSVTVQVAEIRVEANRAPPQNADPGGAISPLPAVLIQRLPLEGRDATDLVALTPNTVTGMGSTSDSAQAEQSFSIGGSRTGLNRITLDGLSLGSQLSGGRAGGAAPWSVPPEAIRGTQVVVSTYDVSRGQFAGGQVASQSMRGTNTPFGSLSYRLIAQELQSGFGQANGPTPYSLHEISGGWGGPIRKDRSHYFVSVAARRRTDHPYALTAATPDAGGRYLGVVPDSLTRFLTMADTLYGLPALSDTGAYDRPDEAISVLGRLDANVGLRHHVIARAHNTWYTQRNSRIGPFDLTQNGGEAGARSTGAFLGLTSQLGGGGNVLNELRAEYLYEGRPTLRTLGLPQGVVRVVSDYPDSTSGVTSLVFGGERSLPTTQAETRFEATDEMSFIWAETHRLKTGVYFNYTSFEQSAAGNRLGTFTFNSLQDFENQSPASYTRTLDARPTIGSGYNLAFYLGDTWRATPKVQLTYGLRYEVDGYFDSPSYNPTVDAAFGLRTDRVGAKGQLSPRAGFTWRLNTPREPTPEEMIRQFGAMMGNASRRTMDSVVARLSQDTAMMARIRQGARFFAEQQAARVVRGGVGMFRGPAPLGLYSNSLNNTGLSGAETQLLCLGTSVPVPDYAGYLLDPSSIPAACAGPPSTLAARAPQVAVFDPSFAAPVTVRATLGFNTPIIGNITGGVDLMASWGRQLYVAEDANLDTVPEFTLASEGGRPVYAPASSIVALTGEVPLAASRLDTAFGNVLSLRSTGRSWNRSMSLRLQGRVNRIMLGGNYTLAYTDDENSFSCCSALQGFASPTTGGNPNALERSPAAFDRRHTVTLTARVPIVLGFEITAIGRMGSGTPYTPIVGGDVNGDGVRNDRAFVFDPASPGLDTGLSGGMARLLASAPEQARACLTGQLGGVAGRNSCRSPWFKSLDIRLTGRPPVGGMIQRRTEISIDFFNVLAGLDQLFNGDNLKGWGATNQIFGADALLFVRGFDAATQSFRYTVNEAFGRPRWAQFGVGNPFQIQISARVLVGGNFGRTAPGGIPGIGGAPPPRR